MKKKKNSLSTFCHLCFFTFLFFTLFAVFLHPFDQGSIFGQEPPPATKGGHESEGPHFHNLVENPRILFDRKNPPPSAHWDLTEKFKLIKEFQGVEPVLHIVEPGKTSVVEPSLNGNTFILHWKNVGTSEITLEVKNPTTGFTVYDKIRCEAWEPDYWTMFFTVVGGLGVFLLGMKYMSEGLQTVAGESLRRMIAMVTNNRFLAIGVGLLTTAVIQSSSVTTVMVVGFINSQIMTLSQGIGVIMGANIGTTITGWILVLNLGKYGLPMLGFAGFFYLFSKQDRVRFIAMAIMGLGFVFFGLELMQRGFAFLRDLPSFTAWMNSFHADTYFGVLKCVGIGCLLTAVVQSSSATLAITISLAAIGVIPYETAGALVLGENIGTTITAIIASFNTTTNARRAAYFHSLFNIIGVVWVSAIFLPVLAPLVRSIVGTTPDGTVKDITAAIALTHTIFNVANMILFIPFVKIFANLLTRFVPEKKSTTEQKSYLTNLRTPLLETSAISVERSRVEVLRMSGYCLELADWVESITVSPTIDEKLVAKAFRQEEMLDEFQDEIIEFTADLLAGNVSHDVAEIARSQLKMADELESISDYLVVILKSNLKLKNSNLVLPDSVEEQMLQLHNQVEDYMEMIHRYFEARREDTLLPKVQSQGKSITDHVKKVRDSFLTMMSDNRLDPQVIMAVNTQLNAYRRVREHTENVAEAIVGIKLAHLKARALETP